MVLNKLLELAWYKCLTKFLIEKGFEIGKIDSTLFTKRVNGELFVCQIYVDDIIFGSTNPHFSEKFGKLMSEKFEFEFTHHRHLKLLRH